MDNEKYYYLKRIVSVVLLLLLISVPFVTFNLWQTVSVEGELTEFEGEGTKESPYLLSSPEDMINFFDILQTEYTFKGEYLQMTNDISLQGYDMKRDIDGEFAGTLDGAGYTLSNMTVINDHYAAMFEIFSGTVINMNMTESYFEGNTVGAIGGRATSSAQIVNCCVNVTVKGETAGCVLGRGERGIIDNVICEGNVNMIGEDYYSLTNNNYICDEYENNYCSVEKGQEISKDSIVATLNNELCYLNQYYQMNKWEEADGVIRVSGDRCLSFEKAVAKVYFDNNYLSVKGFYSEQDECWYFIYPSQQDNRSIELEFTQGNDSYTYETKGEGEYSFEYNGYSYDIVMVPYEGIETIYLETGAENGKEYLYQTKENELPVSYMFFGVDGTKEAEGRFESMRCRGNDSFRTYDRWKNGFAVQSESKISIFGLDEAYDYVFLPGYRGNCMFSYIIEKDLYKETEGNYAADYRISNLYLNGEYMGAYMITAPMEIADNRYELVNSEEETQLLNTKKLYEYDLLHWGYEEGQTRVGYAIPENPKDITGGYLLEIGNFDYVDEDSRFITPRTTCVCLKSNRYASVEQVDYIADYWEEFEDALFSEDGYNEKGIYYTEYVDNKSVADMMLSFEVTMDGSQWASMFFYKDSDNAGDGRIYAGCHWDMEHSYSTSCEGVDSYCLNADRGFYLWNPFYMHEDFRETLRDEWISNYRPALEILLGDTVTETAYVGSLDEYAVKYQAVAHLNDLRWGDSDWTSRKDSIEEYIRIRMKAIDEWLGVVN